MNTLQVFENPEFGSIRTVEIGGEPWLVGKDVAVALGYNNPRDALRKHVDNDDRNTVAICDGIKGNPNMTIINESGLYSLILSSKLPGAKKFKRWVTAEVLPVIRKTGTYIAPGTEDAPVSKKDVADLTAAVQLLIERMDAQTAQRERLPAPALALPESTDTQEFGPAARKRWMRAVSEKLDLLSTKLNQPHSIVLSQIYKIMEEKWGVNLEEERLKAAEELNLFSCSVLAAISHSSMLRDVFQKIVDFNLAPENRGW